MTISFASLNIGLQRAQAKGHNRQRRFNAVAQGVRRAFLEAEVDAVGLVEVGDKMEGLPQEQADQLLRTIRAHLKEIQLRAHVCAEDHAYMLLSKVGSRSTSQTFAL